jgi:undecaprenyl-diphosphatase
MTTTTEIASVIQGQPARQKAASGLRSPGLLAKWPVVGLMMFIFGCLVFAGLTYNLLAQGPLLEWDKVVANTLPAIALQSPAFVQGIMSVGFYMGKEVVAVLTLLLCLYFLFKRYWQELAMAAIGFAGSTLLFSSLSAFFARPRPPTQIWIVVDVPGFPSGHAIAVIVCYGLLAYLLVPKITSMFWKVFVALVALLIIAFVGFSRIFTGGHYLTDILAGYALGIAWSGLIYTLIELYFQKRRNRNVKKE